MVLIYLLICLLLGAGLAQYFKFMVLVLATVGLIAIVVGSEMALADSVPRILLIAAAHAASLQLGYFIGLSFRFLSKPPILDPSRPFRPHTSHAIRHFGQTGSHFH